MGKPNGSVTWPDKAIRPSHPAETRNKFRGESSAQARAELRCKVQQPRAVLETWRGFRNESSAQIRAELRCQGAAVRTSSGFFPGRPKPGFRGESPAQARAELCCRKSSSPGKTWKMCGLARPNNQSLGKGYFGIWGIFKISSNLL